MFVYHVREGFIFILLHVDIHFSQQNLMKRWIVSYSPIAGGHLWGVRFVAAHFLGSQTPILTEK